MINNPIRLVFAGSTEFARIVLESIISTGYEVLLVLSAPDRPAGRSLRLIPNPVKKLALNKGISVYQPRCLSFNNDIHRDAYELKFQLDQILPDIIIVAAYGLILPKWILNFSRFGCLNIHPSLLPRWRGASPIQRAIEAGDIQTGITIIQMDEGVDTGNILLERIVSICPWHNSEELSYILAYEGACAIQKTLQLLRMNQFLISNPQPLTGITYANKLQKSEAILDFSLSASSLERKIRAFNPFPGAKIFLNGFTSPVKIWRATVLDKKVSVSPGMIQHLGPNAIDIATGSGLLRLLEVQKAGGRRQSIDLFLRGWKNKN